LWGSGCIYEKTAHRPEIQVKDPFFLKMVAVDLAEHVLVVGVLGEPLGHLSKQEDVAEEKGMPVRNGLRRSGRLVEVETCD
jgi:hypothetical protein